MGLDDLPAMAGVLAVVARPNDESSTRHGVHGDLGVIRTGELTAAGAALGVGGVDLRTYPDGHLAPAPVAELTGHVQRLIDAVHPSLLLAFDPNGVTGHPDHQRACQATLAAVNAAALTVLAW